MTYFNKAIVEKEANGSRGRGRGFFEHVGGYIANERLNLRAFFGIVVNGELSRRPTGGGIDRRGLEKRIGEG